MTTTKPPAEEEGESVQSNSSAAFNADQNIVNILLTIADSLFAVDLYREAGVRGEEISWSSLSFASYYLGIIGFLFWIGYISMVLIADFVLSAGGIISGGGRALTVWPIPAAASVLIFFTVGRYLGKLERRLREEETRSVAGRTRLTFLFVSCATLIAAATMRAAIYQASTPILGDNPFTPLLVGIMLIDGGYISLVLMGFGGLGIVIFSPE